ERVKQGQADLNRQVDQLKKSTRFSPIDGVVSSLPVKVGEYALASFSTTPLMTVADMSQINTEVKVDETDIADVQVGQKAKVKVQQPAEQAGAGAAKKKEVEGVFVFGKDGKGHFSQITTGIKGDQEIEIKSGLNEGDEIITGPYKTLRTLKDGDQVKREVAP